MNISFVAAISENYALGKDNKLLWHLPDDFKWFKEKTMGKPVIMGRKTMDSLGKPLPKRRNIVISRNRDSVIPGFEWAADKDTALDMVKDDAEVAVIGGGEIYRMFMPDADELVLTFVHTHISDADTFFPAFDRNEWEETYSDYHPEDERHRYAFDFKIYRRVIKPVV